MKTQNKPLLIEMLNSFHPLNEMRKAYNSMGYSIREMAVSRIEELVKEYGEENEDGEKEIFIDKTYIPQVEISGDELAYAYRICEDKVSKVIALEASYERDEDNDDVYAHLADVDLDGQMSILEALIRTIF